MSRRRLHPAAALAGAAEQLRGLAIPIVVGGLLGGGGMSRVLWLGLIGAAIALVGGYVAWQNECYWVGDEGVV